MCICCESLFEEKLTFMPTKRRILPVLQISVFHCSVTQQQAPLSACKRNAALRKHNVQELSSLQNTLQARKEANKKRSWACLLPTLELRFCSSLELLSKSLAVALALATMRSKNNATPTARGRSCQRALQLQRCIGLLNLSMVAR